MLKLIFSFAYFLVVFDSCVQGCLITNCPRGGKRAGVFGLSEIGNRLCTSCGPGYRGQCFGPNICCGPFGCLMGTLETMICKKEAFFHDREQCQLIAMPCRKNTGKCAADNICCTPDGCFIDKECDSDDKSPDMIPGWNVYNLLNKYHSELISEK